MIVTGIIAEYNPFHLGHLYHLNEAKKCSGSTGVIAIISGSFLQRGEPALVDKWVRTEMALRAGIDLVLELPTAFACRSANLFAQGGVKSLAATGIVTHLAFGAETNNLPQLKKVAEILNDEDENFTDIMEESLSLGHSFPKSRSLALENTLKTINEVEINKPNNVLAIEYLRVLGQLKTPIEPVLIPRIGNYHAQSPENGIASASAIRNLLLTGEKSWPQYLPSSTNQILFREFQNNRGPITIKSLEQAIFATIRRMSLADLRKIIEVSEGLENRLKELSQQTGDIETLLTKLKTKRYTYTRMQRLIIHTFLNFTQDLNVTNPQYLRVLGFNSRGKKLLKLMKNLSGLPIITKFAQGYKEINDLGKKLLDLEVLATDLYNLGFPNAHDRKGRQDFYRSPVIID